MSNPTNYNQKKKKKSPPKKNLKIKQNKPQQKHPKKIKRKKKNPNIIHFSHIGVKKSFTVQNAQFKE